jgi:long-chain acyl-CoA synthetase
MNPADDTLARMFWNRVEKSESLPAQMVKRGDQWQALTWAQVGAVVRELALGLIALGRHRGESVALLSTSRAEWVQADFAIFSAGCVTTPIYPTYTPEQIAYIVNDSEARTLIVEDPAQLAKVLEVRGKLEPLEQIVVIQDYEGHEASILTWEELRRLGRENDDTLKGILADRIASVRPEDVATIVYTSGTTGPPKGVVQTHGNHIAALNSVGQATGVKSGDVHLLFLPLAHSFARLESFIGVHGGLTTAFAESLDRLADNLREVRPHFICGVPRVFEKVHARIVAGVEAGSPLKKKIFFWDLGVGRKVSRLQQARQPIPGRLMLKYRIAHKLVFSKLHQALGGRLRFAVSGGAPLSREIAEFFHAAGILILQGYGLTETCPVLTSNRIDHFKFGSVGPAIPGVELKIAPDGEILARGPNVASRGYFKKPEATAEVFEPDGWFHTGDIGRLDDEGFLFITDRKKDLIVTAGGMNIAPQNIENLLKADPFISQAMVYGDRRPYPVALITVNPEQLVEFANEPGILVTDYAQLTKHPKVTERVGRIVEAKNAQLQSYAKIKKFAVLPAEFTQDGGELTPTLKVKRKVVAEKYKDVLESLYR